VCGGIPEFLQQQGTMKSGSKENIPTKYFRSYVWTFWVILPCVDFNTPLRG
jgi:hypothetical protein